MKTFVGGVWEWFPKLLLVQAAPFSFGGAGSFFLLNVLPLAPHPIT